MWKMRAMEVIKNSLSSGSSDYGSDVDCWTTLFEAGIGIPVPWDLKTFGINNFWNMFLTLNSLILDLQQNFLAQIFFSKSHIALFIQCLSKNPKLIFSYNVHKEKDTCVEGNTWIWASSEQSLPETFSGYFSCSALWTICCMPGATMVLFHYCSIFYVIRKLG